MRTLIILISFLVSLILQMTLPGSVTRAEVTLKPPADHTSASKHPLMIRMTRGLLTAEITESPLQTVLEKIARKSGIRIFLDAPTDETVTVTFHDLPLDDGLRRILRGKNVAFIYSIARLEEVHIYTGGGRGRYPDKSVLPETDRVRERTIRDALYHRKGTLRAQAISSLGKSKDKEAIDALGQVLRENEGRQLRKRAAQALGKTWSPDAIDPLSLAILEDEDPSVREAAAKALGKTWSAHAVDPLALSLSRDNDPFVREAAAQALGETWSAMAVDPLSRAVLEDPRRYVREASAKALGEIGGANAVEALVQALGDKDLSVRLGAAEALGATGDPLAAEALIQASVTDKDPWVRQSAAESVWKIVKGNQ